MLCHINIFTGIGLIYNIFCCVIEKRGKIMEQKNKKELLGAAGIFLAALLWGVSYPATKIVEAQPTFFILPVRFLLAAAVLGIVFHRNLARINLKLIKQAFLLSFFITCMYVFSTVGIKYTISARASFFTCLTFVFVPIINRILFKVKINGIIARSIIICFAGVLLLCYTPGMAGLALNVGDLLCMVASVAGSLHIIFLDRISRGGSVDLKADGADVDGAVNGDAADGNGSGAGIDFDPMLFTTLLMAFVALWTSVAALFTGAFRDIHITPLHLGTIIFLGLFCSAIAFLLQSVCQQYVPANRAGVIFAMEPASGCVISVILLNEAMGAAGWIGAGLVLLSSVYMEVASSRKSNG